LIDAIEDPENSSKLLEGEVMERDIEAVWTTALVT
jgi:hypothetical protein